MVKDCESNSSYIASEYFLIMPLKSHHDYHQEGKSAWFESAFQPWFFPGFYTLNLGPSLCLVPCALCLVPCALCLLFVPRPYWLFPSFSFFLILRKPGGHEKATHSRDYYRHR